MSPKANLWIARRLPPERTKPVERVQFYLPHNRKLSESLTRPTLPPFPESDPHLRAPVSAAGVFRPHSPLRFVAIWYSPLYVMYSVLTFATDSLIVSNGVL